MCRPMKPATILRIHSIISSALDLAVRYDWADRNVAKNASPPHPRKREPDPPSPDQAARLLNLVWAEDEEFGLYLWTAFTTGARRGEVSALRENRFDLARQQVRLARNYLVKQGQHIEKAPKDGEGRVLSLDLLTCELFQEHFRRRRAEARALGVEVPEDAFAFSPDPAGREPWNPDTMTHRYRRYARRVGIASSLKELRHYSATQFLAAGTDLNTVAGRLGHAEGSTTLKFYAQFTRPADERAAAVIPSQLDGLRKKQRLRDRVRGDQVATLRPASPSVQLAPSLHAAVLLVNGRSAVRSRSPAPRSDGVKALRMSRFVERMLLGTSLVPTQLRPPVLCTFRRGGPAVTRHSTRCAAPGRRRPHVPGRAA
jgi:integrase